MNIVLENGIIVTTGTNTLSVETVIELFNRTELLEKNISFPRRLTDFRTVESIDLDFRAVLAFADNRQQKPITGKTAMLYSNPMVYGFIRMWISLMESSEVEIQPFQDYDEAMNWLNGQKAESN